MKLATQCHFSYQHHQQSRSFLIICSTLLIWCTVSVAVSGFVHNNSPPSPSLKVLTRRSSDANPSNLLTRSSEVQGMQSSILFTPIPTPTMTSTQLRLKKKRPMPVVGYNAEYICSYYDRRPLVVGWRLNTLSLPLLGEKETHK